jgi:hypothetical protein
MSDAIASICISRESTEPAWQTQILDRAGFADIRWLCQPTALLSTDLHRASQLLKSGDYTH